MIYYNKEIFYSDSEDELSETELDECTGAHGGDVSIGGPSNVNGSVSRGSGPPNEVTGFPDWDGGSRWRACGGSSNGSGGSPNGSGGSPNGSALRADGSPEWSGGFALRAGGSLNANGEGFSLVRVGGPSNRDVGSVSRAGGGGRSTDSGGFVSRVGRSSDKTDGSFREAFGNSHENRVTVSRASGSVTSNGTFPSLVTGPSSRPSNVTSQNVTANNLTSRFQSLGLGGHSSEDGGSILEAGGPFNDVFPSLVSVPAPSGSSMTGKMGSDNNQTLRVEGLSYSSIAKKEPLPHPTTSVVKPKPVGGSSANRYPLHDHRYPKDHQMVIGPIPGTIHHDTLYLRLREAFNKYGQVSVLFIHKYPAKDEGPPVKYGYVVFAEKEPAQRILKESIVTLSGPEGVKVKLRAMI